MKRSEKKRKILITVITRPKKKQMRTRIRIALLSTISLLKNRRI